MARILVADLIDQCKETVPGLQDQHALVYLNQVWRDLLHDADFHNWQITIDLIAGTRVYDLPPSVVRVHNVELFLSDTETVRLRETTIQSEDVLGIKDWRRGTTEGTDQPDRYYIQSINDNRSYKRVIGLLPTPDTTTADGYPKIRIYYVVAEALQAGDYIPENLPSEEVLKWGVCHRASFSNGGAGGQQNAIYYSLYESHKEKAVSHLVRSQRNRTQKIKHGMRAW